MPILHWNLQQGSVDWDRLRSTMPTASRFDEILTPAKMQLSASRKKYACQIIAARLVNWQSMSLDKIQHVEDGRRNEPMAVAQLELIRDIETKPIGFIQSTDGRLGASPDRVVAKGDTIQITVETKCPTAPIQLEYLLAEKLAAMEPKPKDDAAIPYRAQRQGQLLIAEAEEAIFYSYNERMPAVYVRTHRDEPFIEKLDAALRQFADELDYLTEEAKRLGAFQPFEYSSPTDAAYRDQLNTDAEMERLVNQTTYDWGG